MSAARLAAAIDRAGGPGVVREALSPKPDDRGGRKKWAAVCCDAAVGRKPGDPVFTAWVRLAATPVRDVKTALGEPDDRRGRRGPRRQSGAGGPGGDRSERTDRQGAGRGGRPAKGDRKGDRQNRSELARHARDGTLTTGIQIATDREEDKRERERRRKEERERKLQAQRERLSRFGY